MLEVQSTAHSGDSGDVPVVEEGRMLEPLVAVTITNTCLVGKTETLD